MAVTDLTPDAYKLRRGLGELLFQKYKDGTRYDPIDFETVATKVGVTPEALATEINTLKIAGYVDHSSRSIKFDKRGKRLDGGPHPWEQYWKVALTDTGILWANAHFPAIPVPGSNNVSVSVNVHVDIEQTIVVIQEADNTTGEQRERVELLLRRLESEFGKPSGKGKFSAVKDLLEAAAATKSLLGPVLSFLGDHVHEIEGLSEIL